MKIKELFLPLTLALLTTWALQYFWGRNERADNVTVSGQKFEAPTTAQIPLHKPLNLEVDFVDTKQTWPEQRTTIETKNARYVFSSNGACLQQVSFFRNWGGQEGYLSTSPEVAGHDREQCTFLVALQQKTPYFFNLIQETHNEREHILKYQADFDDGVMYKTFTIFHDIHRIDLEVTIDPQQGRDVMPRIFYGSPFLSEPSAEDFILAINNDERGNIQQHPLTTVAGFYWSKPTVFGTMDRYFVYAFIQNGQSLVQRAYYKVVGLNQLYSILEGAIIKEKTSWKLSFYVGPKTSVDLTAVDERLDGVIRYGFLASISKPVSRFMLELLNFFYRFCGNYGVAIILITLLLKLLMLPFTARSEKALSKNKQDRAQFEKKLKYIQEKYKDDPQTLAQERAELLKKHMLPGIGGLVPLLLQLPIIWGLSVALSHSIELYKASFLWIPDLSLPDPYYILPILTGIAVMLNPAGDSQQRLTSIVIGIFLMAFTANFSAGLTLYICVSTWLAIIQSYLVKRWN